MGISSFKFYVNSIDNNMYVKTGSPSTKIGFIPVSMDLTTDGVGGVKIFQRLNVNQEYLPSQYPKSLEFIITKVNHEISNNDWSTSLSTISTPKTKAVNLTGFIDDSFFDSVKEAAEDTMEFNAIPSIKKYTIYPNTIPLYNTTTNTLQYYDTETTKTQIVLHHTAGSRSAAAEITDWIKEQPHVLTHYFIDQSGLATYVYDQKYWAYHLGVGGMTTAKRTLSVELVSIGFVDYMRPNEFRTYVDKNGKTQKRKVVTKPGWYDNYGNEIAYANTGLPYRCVEIGGKVNFEVMKKGYKGHKRYQKYTKAQINSLEKVLRDMQINYPDIPIKMDKDHWELMFPTTGNPNFENKKGVFTHNTWRTNKSDIYPDIDLLRMLQKFN
jgi:hypothetical protein